MKNLLRKSRRVAMSIIGQDVYSSVELRCPKEYLGTQYGGWSICPSQISDKSIVYSFGVGEDISFDLSLIEKFGVNVYAFDPTPTAIDWIKSQQLPKNFKFFEYGIADYDGVAEFSCPPTPNLRDAYSILNRPGANCVQVKVYRLNTIMEMLGHQKIDILKMDIEGAEYAVIDDVISSDIEVQQLLLEFHHRWKEFQQGFRNIGVPKTKRAITSLREKGFKIFDISLTGDEYSFFRV